MKVNYKKIFCLILAMVFCFSAVASAAEKVISDETSSESVLDEETLTAMFFLREFGVIADYYDYNTDPNEKITRAEFVQSVAKLLNVKETYRETTHFYDVPPTHFAANEINAVFEMGFINGVGDNRFAPNEFIDTMAAYRILLAVLNYAQVAEIEGGYPSGYKRIADQIKITDGVSFSEKLTRRDMFLMLFEVMDAPSYSSFGTSGELTILEMYHDAFFSEGVVYGARGVSLDRTVLRNYDDVEIDGKIYKSDFDLFDYIGEKVEFIAYNSKDCDGIICCVKNTGTTDILEIKAENFVSFDASTYRLYYETANGSSRSVQLKRGLSLIYNGGLISENISDRINDVCDLKLINEGEGYSVVIAKKKKDFVVKNIDAVTESIFDAVDTSVVYNIRSEDRKYALIRKQTGEIIDISDISAYNVLTVYESYFDPNLAAYGDYLEIVVSSTVIEGETSMVNIANGAASVTIDEKEYKEWKSGLGILYSVGEKVKLYLDNDGEIAYAENVATSSFAAYLIKAKYYRHEDILKITLLKQNGKVEELTCSEKVNLDDTIYRQKPNAVLTALSNPDGTFKQAIALISLDKNDNIKKIDTAQASGREGTLIPGTDGKMLLNLNRKSMHKTGSKDSIIYDSKTVVFGIPSYTTDDPTRFEVVQDISRYYDTDQYIPMVYTYKTTKKEASVVQYMVIKLQLPRSLDGEHPIIVENVVKSLNDDDEICDVIYGYEGKTKVSIVVTPEEYTNLLSSGGLKNNDTVWAGGSISALEKGMVISVNRHYNQNIKTINILYNAEDSSTNYNRIGIIDSNDPLRYFKVGKVKDAEYGIFVIADDDSYVSVNCAKSEIMVYYKDSKRLENGSLSSIAKGDNVVVVQTWAKDIIYVIK